jgi:hypothetical protein
LDIEYGFCEIKFSPWKGSHQVRPQRKSFIPYNVQWDMNVVPGIFLIAGTVMSLEINAFSKLELLKITTIVFTPPGLLHKSV